VVIEAGSIPGGSAEIVADKVCALGDRPGWQLTDVLPPLIASRSNPVAKGCTRALADGQL